jgi:putative protease
MEAALAAFLFGADAVYLGLQRFSARAEAENFGPDELSALVALAHGQHLTPRRKVFVALNTLLVEAELPELIDCLGLVDELGVDAVILQDLAVARLARRHFPNLALHASTQMAVHSRQGVEALARLGFERVVLARELCLDEIAAAARVDGVEIETFLHGALCYAYSGLCLFSSQLIGKSGNRGACAYPCRDLWRVERTGERGHCFSMKDLALGRRLSELRAAGVASLKIEGRKKSPLYVAATVDHYRRLLDGKDSIDGEASIQTIFSRPWTELYARSRRAQTCVDPSFTGHRGARLGTIQSVQRSSIRLVPERSIEKHDGLQIELAELERPFGFGVDELRLVQGSRRLAPVVRVEAGALVEVTLPKGAPALRVGMEVRHSASNALKRAYDFPRPNVGALRCQRPLSISARLTREALILEGRSGAISAREEVLGPFEPAKDATQTADAMRRACVKLGNSQFELALFELDDVDGCFVPLSRLNTARRALIDRLGAALKENQARRLDTALEEIRIMTARPSAAPTRWILKVDRLGYLERLTAEDWAGIDEIIIQIPQTADISTRLTDVNLDRSKLRWALPVLTRAHEADALRANIAALRVEGFARFEIANLSGFSFLDVGDASELDITADWPLYALNTQSAEALFEMGIQRVTLSPEDSLDNWRALVPRLASRTVAIVYQDTPLFLSEACPKAALAGRCPGPSACDFSSMKLVGSHGTEIDVFSAACRTVALSAAPLNLTRQLRQILELGVGAVRADFAWRPYTPDEVARLWREIRARRALAGGHGANFQRGL